VHSLAGLINGLSCLLHFFYQIRLAFLLVRMLLCCSHSFRLSSSAPSPPAQGTADERLHSPCSPPLCCPSCCACPTFDPVTSLLHHTLSLSALTPAGQAHLILAYMSSHYWVACRAGWPTLASQISLLPWAEGGLSFPDPLRFVLSLTLTRFNYN